MEAAVSLLVHVKETAARITSKGQVTSPADIRENAVLLPNTDVEFQFDGDTVRIVRAGAKNSAGRGARIVAHFRRHGGDVVMTTDAIMALTRGE